MTKNKFPCKYHPGILETRRCFQCKANICKSCQTKVFHHLFCSYSCILKFILHEKLLKERRYREYAALILIMMTIQIVIVLLLNNPDSEKDPGAEIETLQNRAAGEINELKFSADTLFSNSDQSVRIAGKAPVNTLLGLWKDGVFLAAAETRNYQYEFPLQSLASGTNKFVIWAIGNEGQATLVDSITIEYNSEKVSALANPINKVHTDKKILSLTFDGGSYANGADSIITILAEKNVTTTFFLTGTFIRKFPVIIQRMIEHNHELANHTYSHPHLTSYAENFLHNTLPGVDRRIVIEELQKTDSLFNAIHARHLAPFWRAPFGEFNKNILLWAAEAGYKHIGWSRGGDTRDWINDSESSLYRSANEIYEYLLEMASDDQLKGAILLMHLHSDRDDDMPYKILARLIEDLHQKGYEFVTVSELIHAATPI